MTIITFDPSGDSTSGVFNFHNWSNYSLTHFSNQDWREQVQFFKSQIKTGLDQAQKMEEEFMVLYENSNFCRGANKSFLNLIRAVAGLSLFCYEKRIPACTISSRAVNLAKKEAKKGVIKGLEWKWGKGWSFRGKKIINDHELDALLVFYVFWVKQKGEEWPWIK